MKGQQCLYSLWRWRIDRPIKGIFRHIVFNDARCRRVVRSRVPAHAEEVEFGPKQALRIATPGPQSQRRSSISVRDDKSACSDRQHAINFDVGTVGGYRCDHDARPLRVTPRRTRAEHIKSASAPRSGHLADMPGRPLGAKSGPSRGPGRDFVSHVPQTRQVT